MKWGIIATGAIARMLAQTINQTGDRTLLAVGPGNAGSARAFSQRVLQGIAPLCTPSGGVALMRLL